MNGLGIRTQADGLARRFASLPPELRKEVLTRSIAWGVERGLQEAKMPGMGALGQEAIFGAISVAIEKVLAPIIPMLGQKLLEIAKPAAEKAAEVIRPAIRKELQAQLPLFAFITGIVGAGLSIAGMLIIGGYVVKKVA